MQPIARLLKRMHVTRLCTMAMIRVNFLVSMDIPHKYGITAV